MKLKNSFVLRTVAGQHMVVPVGEAAKEFHGMIKLNDTGKLIWEGIESGLTVEKIAENLVEEYEVSYDKALSDTQKLVDKIRGAGFLDE